MIGKSRTLTRLIRPDLENALPTFQSSELIVSEPIVSIVMIRNLGNLRLLPAMMTIGSLLIFTGLCYMLHERDKELMRRRAEFEKAA